ncbi:MAG: patatin-like phospholipase family protein [Pseudomonadota bacterium]
MSNISQKTHLRQSFITLITYLSISTLNAGIPTLKSIVDESSTSSKTVRILSFDGGGVRGIVEAELVRLLEERLNEKQSGDKHVYLSDYFDIIGGTSAGGMLATFLTTPSSAGSMRPKYTAEDIVDILYHRVSDMFVPRIISFGGLFGAKYRIDCLRSVAHEYLGDEKTNNTTRHTAVLTYDIRMQEAKLITSWDTKEVFSKVDASTATAAAPSYFDPCEITTIPAARRAGVATRTPKAYTLIDGGTAANNPALYLTIEAKKLYPQATQFELVSIGSGHSNKPLFDMQEAGMLAWAPHVVSMFISAQTAQTEAFLAGMVPGNYTRLTPLLNRGDTRLDNTDATNMAINIIATRRYVNSQIDKIDMLIDRLLKPRTDFL